MKICLLSNALSIHTKRWIECLQSMGHEVYLISFRKDNIKDIYFRCYEPFMDFFLFKALFFIKSFLKIKKEILQIKPDILHAHYITNYGLLGALLGYHPLIISVWGSDLLVDSKKSIIHRFIIKQTLQKADLVTVMANHMIPMVKKMSGKSNNIIKVTLGVDINRFNIEKSYTKNSTKCVLLSCRTFEKEQNVEDIIRSLPYVFGKTTKDVEVWFCNNGTLLQQAQNLCIELGVMPHVKFFGSVEHEDMSSYYAKSDIYVSSSTSDGDHVSLMEAMACGLFPIVSDIPANLEWITDGENGFIVPLGDHELFAEKILEAVSNEELRDKVRKINFDLVKSKAGFGKDLIMLEDYYRKLSKENKNNRKSV